jgi:hypothetical protein
MFQINFINIFSVKIIKFIFNFFFCSVSQFIRTKICKTIVSCTTETREYCEKKSDPVNIDS